MEMKKYNKNSALVKPKVALSRKKDIECQEREYLMAHEKDAERKQFIQSHSIAETLMHPYKKHTKCREED